MKNSSILNYQYFQFTVFGDYGPLRYVFFSLCLLLYMIIISANVIVILTICLEKSLHQPMFIFICCLCCNSVLGSTGFFPRFLLDLLSDSHWISRLSCLVQVYVIYSYGATEMMILGVMAYDRFVAICQPLHYHKRMTFNMVLGLVALSVGFPAFAVSLCVVLGSLLPLCRYKLHRVFCANVVVLSCVDTTMNVIAGQFLSVTNIFLPFFFVLYSYLRILVVCRRSSAEVRGKALQTCMPHILTFIIFSLSYFCELLLSRLRPDGVNPVLIVLLSFEFLTVPPISNPLVYGLNLPQIRGVIFTRLKIRVKCSSNLKKSHTHT